MPKTLAGFLLLAGLILLVWAVIGKPMKIKDMELQELLGWQRILIGGLGVTFMIVSTVLFATRTDRGPIPMMAPQPSSSRPWAENALTHEHNATRVQSDNPDSERPP
ncbi:hypothetical protein GCM10027285_10220 [Oleiagrimonas citrea]|uniref:Uncharacterized protein n=1 Tax=Oleiagrimonas citrea TaxID=1665687 RepID=A0A846ZL51_9GAMM|nr:hypothetical protein [Oleiagrimonas citrea]NKZ38417.1 hypothetical protein [Oleiagrimonas citrea]